MQRSSFRLAIAAGVLVLGAAVVTAPAQAAPTARPTAGNPLGVQVARFATGTSQAQMVKAVTDAGGEVVTDLSKLGRIGFVGSAPAASKIRANRLVTGVTADRFVPIGFADATGASASAAPTLSGTGSATIPDPWHDLDSFLGESAPGVLQWDDDANGARGAWATTTGDKTVRVAVLDTGVDESHKELRDVVDKQSGANTIPCNLLTRQFGPGVGQRDCGNTDTEGHGTWVASRIAGQVNGFASNGIAPGVQIVGYKVLSTSLGGGLTTWIVDAMVRACDADVDLINMSLGGYNRLGADDADTLLWVDAVNYCRAKGTAIIASAGNEHVRINRTDLVVGGRPLTGVGQVDTGDEGILTIVPGDTVANNDLRGLIETPAGIPGVIMVSSSANANGDPGAPLPAGLDTPTVGLRDQLAYYSNYGSRIDISAPGGARKVGMPRYDVGPADILYGGWGELGALTANGEICQDPSLASTLTFTCFKVNGAAFGWLQGTSMSAPNATGVAALVLSADHGLQANPDGLLAQLQATARQPVDANQVGPADPDNHAAGFDQTVPCTSGWCHLEYGPDVAISSADAYGAGIVNAAAAVS